MVSSFGNELFVLTLIVGKTEKKDNNHRAYVEQEGQTVPIELKLIDDGSGADNIADDGIYSRFFAHYNGVSGRYTLRCQVNNQKRNLFTI